MNRLSLKCIIGASMVLMLVILGFVLVCGRFSRQSELGSRAEVPKKRQSEPEAEKLYQMALAQKDSGDSAIESYRKVKAYYHQIRQEYPQSLQADKARVLMRQMRQNLKSRQKQEIAGLNRSGPRAKKSRTLRRRRPSLRHRSFTELPKE